MSSFSVRQIPHVSLVELKEGGGTEDLKGGEGEGEEEGEGMKNSVPNRMMNWAWEEVRAESIDMNLKSIVARDCPGGAGIADQINCLVRSLNT